MCSLDPNETSKIDVDLYFLIGIVTRLRQYALMIVHRNLDTFLRFRIYIFVEKIALYI